MNIYTVTKTTARGNHVKSAPIRKYRAASAESAALLYVQADHNSDVHRVAQNGNTFTFAPRTIGAPTTVTANLTN